MPHILTHQNSVMQDNSAISSYFGRNQNAAPDSHQNFDMQHNSAIPSNSGRNQNDVVQKLKSFFKGSSNSSNLD